MYRDNKFYQLSTNIVFWTTASLLSIWVALYNGFPAVYADSGSYLDAAITLKSPLDRPIFYSIYLRITAMEEHLWVPVILQGLITSFVITRVVQMHIEKYTKVISLIIILLLAIFTGFSWYNAQLMPDLFTPITVLLAYLFIRDNDGTIWRKIAYGFMLFSLTGTHLSNVPIVIGVIGCIAIFHIGQNWREKKRYYIVGLASVLVVSAYLVQSFVNYVQFDSFVPSRHANLFLIGKLNETNLYRDYVNDNPNSIDIPFAECMDTFPEGAMGFLWAGNSPLNVPGADKVEINKWFAPVLKDFFSIPKYRNAFIKEFFDSGYIQLQLHKVGSGLHPYNEGSPPYYIIEHFYETQLPEYKKAKQQTDGIEWNYQDSISRFIYFYSFYSVIFLLLFRPIRKEIGILMVVLIAGVVCNAYVTGGLANVYERLQSRVNWLLLFGSLLGIYILVKHFISKKSKATNQD